VPRRETRDGCCANPRPVLTHDDDVKPLGEQLSSRSRPWWGSRGCT
jgi:hypothetical protein